MNKNVDIFKINEESLYIYNHIKGRGILIHPEVYKILLNYLSIEDLLNNNLDDSKDFWQKLSEYLSEMEFYEEESFIEKDAELNVTWIMTDYCNLFCKHCSHEAIPKGNRVIEADVNILGAILDKLKPGGLILSGGEPMILSNFMQVVDILRNRYSGKLNLATNGTLISRENINIIKAFDSIDISIDGMTEEETDSIRGKGTYKKVIKTLDLLKEVNFKNISLSMVFNKDNDHLYSKFIEYCKKSGYKPVCRYLSLVGRAKDNFSEDVEMYGILSGGFSVFDAHYECKACLNSVTVDSKGDVYPCNLFMDKRFRIGNILEDNNIFDKMERDKKNNWYKEFSEYISWERKECSDCEYKRACWSCPGMAYGYEQIHGNFRDNDQCKSKYLRIKEEMRNLE